MVTNQNKYRCAAYAVDHVFLRRPCQHGRGQACWAGRNRRETNITPAQYSVGLLPVIRQKKLSDRWFHRCEVICEIALLEVCVRHWKRLPTYIHTCCRQGDHRTRRVTPRTHDRSSAAVRISYSTTRTHFPSFGTSGDKVSAAETTCKMVPFHATSLTVPFCSAPFRRWKRRCSEAERYSVSSRMYFSIVQRLWQATNEYPPPAPHPHTL